MLINIKSSYSIRYIFSHINETIEFDIIKYNKILQNIIGISLINYQLLSRKYIEYDSDKIVKLYNAFNDILIYEGEFLKGKRNGKGKEYNNVGKLMFEGIYLKGKKWTGKYKKYNDNNQLLFEGKYLDGKINGIGKEYNNQGNIIFKVNILMEKN